MPSTLFKILSIFIALVPSLIACIFCLKLISTSKIVIASIAIFFIALISFNLLLKHAKKFQSISLKPSKIQPVNREMMVFLLMSFLPILTLSRTSIEMGIVLFFIFFLLSVAFLTDSYYCNPMFGFLGYKMYQIEYNGVVFLLITKKNLQKIIEINVVELSTHLFLET